MSGEGILETAKDAAAEGIRDAIREATAGGSGMGAMEMPGGEEKPFQMPTKEELLAMLDTFGLSPEEQAELKAALLQEDSPMGGGMPMKQPWSTQALILVSFLMLIVAVLSLIFYRIYKSEVDKEKKKEEKKQLKMAKKNKYKTK